MRPVIRDRLVTAACGLTQLVTVTPGEHDEPGGVAAGISVAIGLAAAATLLARRTDPLPVVAVAAVSYPIQVALVGPILPATLLAASYAASRYGPQPLGAGVAAAASILATVAVVLAGASVAASYAVVLLVTVLVGSVLASVSTHQQARTSAAVADERLRIARDLHDVVGHGLGAITVQAGAGRLALDAGAAADVRSALVTIEQVGHDVLRDVRWLVGLLRDRPPRPGLTDLAALARTAGQAGLTVSLDVRGPVDQVPSELAEAAYRVVQEGLTNVLRHADRTAAAVQVRVGSEVVVEVLDDGIGSTESSEGNGIRGLRERVTARGGELDAGPRSIGGWRLAATWPLPSTRGRRR